MVPMVGCQSPKLKTLLNFTIGSAVQALRATLLTPADMRDSPPSRARLSRCGEDCELAADDLGSKGGSPNGDHLRDSGGAEG